MLLEILKYPDERLKKVSKSVTQFDKRLHKFLDDMAETMYAANGVGLAAPQVNRFERFFLVDIEPADAEERNLFEIINPKISQGEGKISYEEGCLSVPGVSEEVTRKVRVRVDYQDRFGKPQVLIAEDLLSVAIQHEYDHLEGILFIEQLSPLKRRFLRKKLSKLVTL